MVNKRLVIELPPSNIYNIYYLPTATRFGHAPTYRLSIKDIHDILLMLHTSGVHQLEVGSLCPQNLPGFLDSWVVQDLFHQQ